MGHFGCPKHTYLPGIGVQSTQSGRDSASHHQRQDLHSQANSKSRCLSCLLPIPTEMRPGIGNPSTLGDRQNPKSEPHTGNLATQQVTVSNKTRAGSVAQCKSPRSDPHHRAKTEILHVSNQSSSLQGSQGTLVSPPTPTPLEASRLQPPVPADAQIWTGKGWLDLRRRHSRPPESEMPPDQA